MLTALIKLLPALLALTPSAVSAQATSGHSLIIGWGNQVTLTNIRYYTSNIAEVDSRVAAGTQGGFTEYRYLPKILAVPLPVVGPATFTLTEGLVTGTHHSREDTDIPVYILEVGLLFQSLTLDTGDVYTWHCNLTRANIDTVPFSNQDGDRDFKFEPTDPAWIMPEPYTLQNVKSACASGNAGFGDLEVLATR